VRRELIGPEAAVFSDETAFRFRHLLIRDVAYASMPKELRAGLHERFAVWLEEHARQRRAEYEEIVAYHLEQAYRHGADLGPVTEREKALGLRAAKLLIEAARRSSARGDVRGQASFLQRAVALLSSDDPSRLEPLLELGTIIASLESYARSEEILAEVAEAAAASGNERLRYNALLEQSIRRGWADPASRTGGWLDLIERAIAVFERSDDIEGLARAWRHLGLLHQIHLEWDAEHAALEKAPRIREAGEERARGAVDPHRARRLARLGTTTRARGDRSARAAASWKFARSL
jgi:hypothetical protein